MAHFIVSDDVERSRRFYTEVLGRHGPRSLENRGPVLPVDDPLAGAEGVGWKQVPNPNLAHCAGPRIVCTWTPSATLLQA